VERVGVRGEDLEGLGDFLGLDHRGHEGEPAIEGGEPLAGDALRCDRQDVDVAAERDRDAPGPHVRS